MAVIFYIFLFLIGLSIGSFLNVCIYRLPRDISIVKPRSFCPRCERKIKFYDNIPFLSFIILGAKCRNCNEPISIRYPVVELLTALLCVSLFFIYGYSVDFLMYFIFSCALLVVTFIDIDFRIIPDVISLPGIVIGLVFSFFAVSTSIKNSLIGALVGFVAFFLISFIYTKLTSREGMGGGDIKLIAMIGAFVGLQGVILSILFGSLAGVLYAVFLLVTKKGDMKSAIPYGPFLSIGALLYVFKISSYLLGFTQF